MTFPTSKEEALRNGSHKRSQSQWPQMPFLWDLPCPSLNSQWRQTIPSSHLATDGHPAPRSSPSRMWTSLG